MSTTPWTATTATVRAAGDEARLSIAFTAPGTEAAAKSATESDFIEQAAALLSRSPAWSKLERLRADDAQLNQDMERAGIERDEAALARRRLAHEAAPGVAAALVAAEDRGKAAAAELSRISRQRLALLPLLASAQSDVATAAGQAFTATKAQRLADLQERRAELLEKLVSAAGPVLDDLAEVGLAMEFLGQFLAERRVGAIVEAAAAI